MTDRLRLVPTDRMKEIDMAMTISADDQGRVQLPEGSAGRDYGLYRNPTGKIELVPLPMAAGDDEDDTTIASDPALIGGPSFEPTPNLDALEQQMIQSITAYFKATGDGGNMSRLRAVEIRAVTDNGDLPSGERAIYRTSDSYISLFMLCAPFGNATPGAHAPYVRAVEGLGGPS